MKSSNSRRSFLQASAATALGAGITASTATAAPVTRLFSAPQEKKPRLFEISLAQWSLHRTIRQKKMDNLDNLDLEKVQ